MKKIAIFGSTGSIGTSTLNIIITHYHKDHFGNIGVIQYASYTYHNLGLLSEKVKIFLPKTDFGFNKASIISNNENYCDYFDLCSNTILNIDDLKICFEDNRHIL